MSDLGRLRRDLAETERAGKRIRRQLDFLRSELEGRERGITRPEEREITRLESSLDFWRQRYANIKRKLEAEEKRLLADPSAFLRFT